MSSSLTLACQIISCFSFIVNIYLLYIYQICAVRVIKSYKYIILITALQNILFSLSIILVVPVPLTSDFALTLAGIGPLHMRSGGQVMIVLFNLIFITSLLIVTNSFIYRYVHICRLESINIVRSAKGIFAFVIINAIVLASWQVPIYTIFWPNLRTIEQLKEVVFTKLGVNLFDCAQINFSLKSSRKNVLDNISAVSLLLGMSVLMIIMIYSAIKINSALKSAMFSNTMKMHRQMFTLLLLQTACPISLLHVPCFVTIFFMLIGVEMSSGTSHLFGISLSLFPFISTLIIIGFLKEYRNYTLNKLRLPRKSVPFCEHH